MDVHGAGEVEKIFFVCFEHHPTSRKYFGKCSGVGTPRSQREMGGELSVKTKTLGGETGKQSGREIVGYDFKASARLKPLVFRFTVETGHN